MKKIMIGLALMMVTLNASGAEEKKEIKEKTKKVESKKRDPKQKEKRSEKGIQQIKLKEYGVINYF